MDYRVELPEFSGPMDLLLHLVKKQEVSIREISVSRVLDDFLAHLKALETLDLDDIGEFVVMATLLMEIKSREIIPHDTVDLATELDPRDELIRQLLEYRRYRELTRRLETRGSERELVFSRGSFGADSRELRDALGGDDGLEELDVWVLLKAYAQLLEATDFDTSYDVRAEQRPLSLYRERLVARLTGRGRVRFTEVFDASEGRDAIIGTFLALLELVKQARLAATQDDSLGEIWIELVEHADEIAELSSDGGA